MVQSGYLISGIGHTAVILWVMVGGFLDTDHIPDVQTAEVSIITEEEFAALSAPQPAALTAPEPESPEAAPTELDSLLLDASPLPEVVPEVPAPEATPEVATPEPLAEAETAPDEVPEPPSKPEPVVLAPAPSSQPLPQPETPDSGVDLTREPPAQARRIASRPRLAFAGVDTLPAAARERIPPTTRRKPEDQPPEPEPEPAQVEETTTEIVTEADEPSLAPAQTPRPRQRPVRVAEAAPEPDPEPAREPEPEPEPAPDPEPEPETDATEIAAAIEAANAEAEAARRAAQQGAGTASSGPPITSAEKEALGLAISECWIVDPGSPAARVVVEVGFSMFIDGRVDTGSVQLVSATGGDDRAQKTAYESARRAIIRCYREGGREGYELPVEKYEQWRNTIVTFNPESMRVR